MKKTKPHSKIHHLLQAIERPKNIPLQKGMVYNIQIPKLLNRAFLRSFVLGCKGQTVAKKHTFSLAQKGFQPSWAWFVCLLAMRADLTAKHVVRWDVEGRSISFKGRAPLLKKTDTLAFRRIAIETEELEEDPHWQELMQRTEERHFQIGRIIKYLSE